MRTEVGTDVSLTMPQPWTWLRILLMLESHVSTYIMRKESHNCWNYFFVICAAALRIVSGMEEVNDLHFVPEQSTVSLECLGSGSLVWTSSTGLEIPFDESNNIYQSYNETRDALTLVISNFTNSTTATYTCMANLTDSIVTTSSILVTSCKSASSAIVSRYLYELCYNFS